MNTNEINWLTVTEASAYLKIKPRTLLAWAKCGQLRGYKLSGTKRVTWRFLQADLDTALLGSPVLVSLSPSAAPTNGRIQ